MESFEVYLDGLINSIKYLLNYERECILNHQFYDLIVQLKTNLMQEYSQLEKILKKLESTQESSKNDVEIMIKNQFTNRIGFDYFLDKINNIKNEIAKSLSILNVSSDHAKNLERFAEFQIKYKNQEFKLDNMRLYEKELIENIEILKQELESLEKNLSRDVQKTNFTFEQSEPCENTLNSLKSHQDYISEYFILSDEQKSDNLEEFSKKIKLDLKSRFINLKEISFSLKYFSSKINLQSYLIKILNKNLKQDQSIYFFVLLFNDYYKVNLDFTELEMKAPRKKLDFTFIINNKIIDSIPFFKSDLIKFKRVSGNKNDLFRKFRIEFEHFREEFIMNIDLINQAKDNIKIIKDFQNEVKLNYELSIKENEQKVNNLVKEVKAFTKEETNEIIKDRLNKLNEFESELFKVNGSIFDISSKMEIDRKIAKETEKKIKDYIAKMNQNTQEFFYSSKSIYFFVLKIVNEFESKISSLSKRQRMLENCLNKIMNAIVNNQSVDYLNEELKHLIYSLF